MEQQYQHQQAIALLKSLQSKKASGTLYLEAEIAPKQKKRSRVLVWKDGYIVFGGIKILDNQSFVKMLEQKLNREWVDAAVSFALRQATSQTSTRALLEQLVRMQLFSWEQIETVIHDQVILTLEQVLPHAGQFQFDSKAQFKLCRGLELPQLMLDVAQRQEQWFELKSLIPSLEAVPYFQADVLETITDPSVHKHLHEWVDGKRSLVDIAEALNKDPLHLAQSYLPWLEAGWIAFEGSTCTARILLPTILAVDESAVIQQAIKRALTGYCQVLVASNARDALNIMYCENISLLLLDDSPDMDGLQLCRTVRNIPRFCDLPIIMLTVRDGFLGKMKGRFAGSTEYLTKPFDTENLRELVGKYVNLGIAYNPQSISTEFDLSTSN